MNVGDDLALNHSGHVRHLRLYRAVNIKRLGVNRVIYPVVLYLEVNVRFRLEVFDSCLCVHDEVIFCRRLNAESNVVNLGLLVEYRPCKLKMRCWLCERSRYTCPCVNYTLNWSFLHEVLEECLQVEMPYNRVDVESARHYIFHVGRDIP